MRKYLKTQARRAAEAAASLTGKRFGLLVASSLVATAAIVAAALSNPSGVSPLAALVGQSLASGESQPAPAPAPEPSPPAPSGGPAASSPVQSDPGPEPTAPLPTPEPTEQASPSAEPEPTTTPTAPTEQAPEAGLIKHVFVLNLISPGYEAAFGAADPPQMPYLSTELRPQGELLSGYQLLHTASLPNDLAAVAGLKPDAKTKAGCPNFAECVLPLESPTIADLLTIGRFKWRAYMEGMTDPATGAPGNCVYPAADEPYPPAEGGYTAARNPFVFFHSLLDLGDCSENDVPLTDLDKDLRKVDSTANLVYVTPGLCNAGAIAECPAGQNGGPAAADAFLAAWVPKILKSPAFKADGLLIVAFDQVEPAPAADGTVPPASTKVGALLVSRFLSPGATDPKPYDPYALLRSLEDLFGVEHLGAAGAAKVKPFASTTLLREGTGD
jgi:phosphatidylinositol-3-phosphatase